MSTRRSSLLPRLVAASVLALGAAVAGAVPAGATTTSTAVADAAAAFRTGESVYVDPAADPSMTVGEAEQLRAQIRDTGYPFFVAVLPDTALVSGSSNDTVRALYQATGLQGTYAAFIGGPSGEAFRAGDTGVSVNTIATVAYRDNKDAGVYAVSSAFVTAAVPVVAGGGTGGDTTGSTSGESSSGGGAGVLGFFALVVAAIGGGAWWISRKAKKANAERTAAIARVVDEDVTSYGEVVAQLDVEDPRLDDAGRADAQKALDSYEQAKMLSARMARPEDAGAVTSSLEEGRFALATVQARLDGQPLPDRRPPCFVDPRHGPSFEDVQWAPDGGAERAVPVCRACALTLKSGGMPQAREVEMAGGGRVPYWQGGQAYAPYAGGYFGGAGMNVMSMLFMGSMLGGAFSTPAVIAPTDTSGLGGGGGDLGSGFGGGDFGGSGGDFGGGGDF